MCILYYFLLFLLPNLHSKTLQLCRDLLCETIYVGYQSGNYKSKRLHFICKYVLVMFEIV